MNRTVPSAARLVNGSGVVVALHRNEMPLPAPPSVRRAARAGIADLAAYPSLDAPRLRQELPLRYGVSPEWFVAGAGSVSVIAQVMTAVGAGQMITPWPGFEALPTLAASRGLTTTFTAVNDASGTCDLDEVRAAVRPETSLIVLCTPHSPTGGVLTHSELAAFLADLSPRITVLIDQAYAEFADYPDPPRPVELVTSHPRTVVTRTFSKAYGLAGLRVGYALTNPDFASTLAASGVPYAVTAAAEAAAVAALRRPKDLEARVAGIRAERARLAEALAGHGVDVRVGHGNFVWLPRSEAVSATVERLAAAGVLVKGYPGEGIRVSVGTRADTDRLIRAWTDLRLAAPPEVPR